MIRQVASPAAESSLQPLIPQDGGLAGSTLQELKTGDCHNQLSPLLAKRRALGPCLDSAALIAVVVPRSCCAHRKGHCLCAPVAAR